MCTYLMDSHNGSDYIDGAHCLQARSFAAVYEYCGCLREGSQMASDCIESPRKSPNSLAAMNAHGGCLRGAGQRKGIA